MDFATLKQKFSETAENLTQKAKEFGDKTLEFVGDNLANTPLFIQTEDEMNKELENKRVIFIAFDEKTDFKKQIALFFPIWRTKIFIDGGSLSFLNHEKSEMLIQTQKFSLPLEMRVYFEGIETLRLNHLEDIKKWWENENRDYE